jgi:acetyl esterase/lipase
MDMSIRTRVLQGILVAVSQRSASKPFDPVKDRARGAKLEHRFKPRPGVTETEVTLGGVPCRKFTSGGGARGTFFHLHGGGYTGGSAAVGRLYTRITADGGPDIVSVDYRLAPEHPYPAAVDDALAAYRALLETVPAEKVVVGGESAGGNLALALVQRLIAEDLPLPVAVVPIYPWSDLTHTSASWTTNGRRDILTKQGLDHCSLAYAGTLPLDDPKVSPQFGSFAGFPPAFIAVGTRDCLLEDARAVTRALRAEGVDVTLREWDGAIHGFTVLPTKESKEAMAEIRDFVLKHLPA